jgi:hypothetical protein
MAPAPARYQSGRWAYNTRVASAIVPSILMLAGAGGAALLGTLLVGLMVSYILDVLKMTEGALVSVWATLIGRGPHVPFPFPHISCRHRCDNMFRTHCRRGG